MKIKKEFVIYDEVYRFSVLCMFNLSKKEMIKRANKYKDSNILVKSLEEIKEKNEQYCFDGNKKYLLVVMDFCSTDIEDLACLVHETRHLSDFLIKTINFEEEVCYTDLEPPAYLQQFLFKKIISKYIENEKTT